MQHQHRFPVTTANLLLLTSTVVTALIAGLYYGWSCSVIPGLHQLDDGAFITAMNAMNRAILNPVFFATFMGTAVLLPVAAYLHRADGLSPRFPWLVAASVVYIVGSLGVTMMGNVPLNDALGAVDAGASDIARHRAAFEGPWVRLHTIRTWATVASLVLAVIACLVPVGTEIR